MSVLPYLPGGQSELPAERFILFANTLNKVEVFDESVKTADGVSFTASWESASLSRNQTPRTYTLSNVYLYYSSTANTTVLVEASGDGGQTWSVSRTVTITAPRGIAVVHFPVSGEDLRFRITFNTDEIVNIFAFSPTLVERGMVEYAAF